MKRNEITVGAGIRTSPSEFHQIVPTVEFLPAKQTYNIFSGFAQDDIDLVRNRWPLTRGSKFESTTFSGFNYQPSGRLTLTPDDNRAVWVGVTRGAHSLRD